MAEHTEYILEAGGLDRERLTLLGRLYNARTIEFLKASGLKPGMRVLEIGCGTGHMAVALAEVVGPTGKVVASDMSESHLAITKETALAANIPNIECVKLDLNDDLTPLKNQFDFIYGRWVIEFCKDTTAVLQGLFDALKPNGIFSYESMSFDDPGHFSEPHSPFVDQWFALGLKRWRLYGMDTAFIKKLPHWLEKLGITHLKIALNQPVLITTEEKSVLKLGLFSSKEIMFKEKSLTPTAYDDMVAGLETLEQSDAIVGFCRNILVSAKKGRMPEMSGLKLLPK